MPQSSQIRAQLQARLSTQLEVAQAALLDWLQCGLSPRRLAFTLALGFAIGCIPLLGITTGLCAILALIFGLNMPAIQAANWLAMPFQVLLLVPFLRLGQWLFPARSIPLNATQILARIESAPFHALREMSSLLAHAILAWSLTAAPALLLITLALTPLMHLLLRRTQPEIAAEAQG